MNFKHTDCFTTNVKFWKLISIWPRDTCRYYKCYTFTVMTLFFMIYNTLLTINFYFLPRKLDVFIEEMIFYFMEMAVTSKVMTFLFLREKIEFIFQTLEYDVFQPDSDEAFQIVDRAKRFIIKYWRIVAVISYSSHMTHIMSPFIAHLFLPIPLELPISTYSFLPDKIKEMFIYPLYLYQCVGMHLQMLCNLNIDSFFMGLMILCIAQLEVLDFKLRHVTDNDGCVDSLEEVSILKLNECIRHLDEISKFCRRVQDGFSMTLFVQFSMASCILCICLFRFTLPAETSYYVFLATYMTVMTSQIAVPCWFGTRIVETSNSLSLAAYSCDWTVRSRRFKSSLRLFVERANVPLTIVGGKMFPLSLTTFTSISNSAYSFFTLLRHMQTRQS